MKIKIIYSVDFIFGYSAAAWNAYFNNKGHESICVNVRPDGVDHYQEGFTADINLVIGCPLLFHLIGQFGYPATGKNILWMLDPLTHQSSCHRDKVLAFEAIENRFDAIACMDSQIKGYFEQRYMDMPLMEIPYILDEARILKPLPEHQKLIDILMLGRRTLKRDKVVESLHAAGLNVNYMYESCWSNKRKRALINTKLLLQVSMDDHLYFDQYRIFEGCAHGAMMIGHAMPDMEKYGFSNGKNIVVCDVADIPRHCLELLSNDDYRGRIIDNAQAHIRECYTVEKQGYNMLALFSRVLRSQSDKTNNVC